MSRARSVAIAEVKAELMRRLRLGTYRLGERFLSNRALARTFGVSGQTAHDLITEIAKEGWLERRASSGTYVIEPPVRLDGVELRFAARAQRAGSFGAWLLELLLAELARLKVPARVRFVGERSPDPPLYCYPVLWECGALAARLARRRRHVLLLNERCTRGGNVAAFIDSLGVNNFIGGQLAAERLLGHAGADRLAVFSGPLDDERSRERVAGFLSVARNARVIAASTWFFPDGLQMAARLLDFDGVFCCNDRLAQAVLATAPRRGKAFPMIVGFDGAPISRHLRFATVAVPWSRLVVAAGELIQRRLGGDRSKAVERIFSPHLIDGETDLV